MKRHLLEALKAAVCLYALRLAGFYGFQAYVKYRGSVLSSSQEKVFVDPPMIETTKKERKIIKKIVKVPVVKQVERQILQTELTEEEKAAIQQQVEKKKIEWKKKPSEIIRLISTIKASERQLDELKGKIDQSEMSLSNSLENLKEIHESFQKPETNGKDAIETLLPNVRKILENDENDKELVTTTTALAEEELQQLSKHILQGDLDTESVHQIFNNLIMNLNNATNDNDLSDSAPIEEENTKEEDEEDDSFARQSDLSTLLHDTELLLQSRVSKYDNDGNNYFFVSEEITNALKTFSESLAIDHMDSMKEAHKEKQKVLWKQRIEKLEKMIVEQNEQLLQIEHQQSIDNGQMDENRHCIQKRDIQHLVDTGMEALLRKTPLEKVLTESLQYLLVDYMDDIEEIEKYTVTLPKEKEETTLMNEEVIFIHESSSSLLDQENLRSLVDTAILPKVVEWVDTFVETIAGYNDSLDTVIDFLAGDETQGESLGKRFQTILLTSFASVKIPQSIKEMILEAGILTNHKSNF